MGSCEFIIIVKIVDKFLNLGIAFFVLGVLKWISSLFGGSKGQK